MSLDSTDYGDEDIPADTEHDTDPIDHNTDTVWNVTQKEGGMVLFSVWISDLDSKWMEWFFDQMLTSLGFSQTEK